MSFAAAPEVRAAAGRLPIDVDEEEFDAVPEAPPPPRKLPAVAPAKRPARKASSKSYPQWPLIGVGCVLAIVGVFIALGLTQQPAPPPRVDLWLARHETLSTMVNPVADRALMVRVERELRAALAHQTQLSCACMHHLELAREEGSKRACLVGDAFVVNPSLKGVYGDEQPWSEDSPMCDKRSVRMRHQVIYVEMDRGWLRLDGPQAACMQLALEELNGAVKCNV